MLEPRRDNEPVPGEAAPNFHTHERPPAFSDGLHDARQTLTETGTAKTAVFELLDAAWDARNQASVTSTSYDYWAAHLAVYRDTIGLTPERDVERHRRLLNTA